MIERLHLVPFPFTLVKGAVWLFMVHPTLCVNEGSSLEAAPISYPASETWYVSRWASPTAIYQSTKLGLGMATMVRGLHSACKWALQGRT